LLVDVFLLKKCVTRVSTGQVSTDGHFFILVEVITIYQLKTANAKPTASRA
jgi:hypothetical protein